MSATNFPEFNAAVTELTLKVQNLLGSVATMQSVANVQVAVDKAAAASTSASEAATSAASSASSASAANTSKNAASASETKASQWADNAEGAAVETGKYSAKHHALKSAASASSASGSAATATTKASEAATSATNAANSAGAASTKAVEAETSAANAAGSTTKASQWADNAEGTAVETGKYSAKHHALKAAASAASAAGSSTTATTKAEEASTSATNATTAKVGAETAKVAAEAARDVAQNAAATVVGNLVELGNVDLSGGTYPAVPTNSSFWKVTVGGTVGEDEYGVGDTLVYSKTLGQFYKIDNTENVSSVAGKKGAVTLSPADVGLGSADNTSDADKPVSTAQQAALDGKVDKVSGKGLSTNDLTATLLNKLNASAPLASPALTGNPTAPTPAAEDSDTSIATTAHVKAAMGLFGLGSRHVVTDADLAPTGLSVLVLQPALNVPGGLSGVGWLETDVDTSFTGSKVQRLQTSDTGKLFTRTVGVTSWQETWHTGNLVKQTYPSDKTVGALMTVGAFGLGTPISLFQTDIGSIDTAGFFICDVCTGTPPGYTSGMLLSHGAGAVVRMQIFNPYGSDKLFFRGYLNGWTHWRELFHHGNILGTVSQSGGVPTGAIIERGSNANGEYTKYADGKLVCTKRISSAVVIGSPGTSLFWTGSRIDGGGFPASFVDEPIMTGFVTGVFPSVIQGADGLSAFSFGGFYHYSDSSRPQAAYTYHLRAEGRWFI